MLQISKTVRVLVLLSAFLLLAPHMTFAEKLVVIGYNVESGQSNPDAIAKLLVSKVKACDIWGFSEVEDEKAAKVFTAAASKIGKSKYKYVLGDTGVKDRLLVVYNARRLKMLREEELFTKTILKGRPRQRAPLVVYFLDRKTKQTFYFMVNHLARGDWKLRQRQSRALNKWAKKNPESGIAVGDYNYDWDLDTFHHDWGFNFLTHEKVFQWVVPKKLIKTHGHPDFNSILDFVFLEGHARKWKAKSTILFPSGVSLKKKDYQLSDHRPVRAVIDIPKKKK